MKIRNATVIILQVLAIGFFFYYGNSHYPCENLKKIFLKYDFNIKIDTLYIDERFLVIVGMNPKNEIETFKEGDSFLFHKKYLFSKGDTLIKKKGELFFELRKYGTEEHKIIDINCE